MMNILKRFFRDDEDEWQLKQNTNIDTDNMKNDQCPEINENELQNEER
jgi:hypothetical protein